MPRLKPLVGDDGGDEEPKAIGTPYRTRFFFLVRPYAFFFYQTVRCLSNNYILRLNQYILQYRIREYKNKFVEMSIIIVINLYLVYKYKYNLYISIVEAYPPYIFYKGFEHIPLYA